MTYAEYVVENPDETPAGRVKITQTTGIGVNPKVTEYLLSQQGTPTSSTWSLEKSTGGQVFSRETTQTTVLTTGSGSSQLTQEEQQRTLEERSGGVMRVVAKQKQTYRKLSDKKKVFVEDEVGYGSSSARKTTWTYYDGPSTCTADVSGHPPRPSIIHGSWHKTRDCFSRQGVLSWHQIEGDARKYNSNQLRALV